MSQNPPQPSIPIVTLQVAPDWIDANGHMTESRYLAMASVISDSLLGALGVDAAYITGGHSYFTAETHILHLGEAKLGDHLTGAIQVLDVDEKRLHLFMTIARDGSMLASIEQMLLHVDMRAGKACAAPPDVQAKLRHMQVVKAHLPSHASIGRRVGQPKS